MPLAEIGLRFLEDSPYTLGAYNEYVDKVGNPKLCETYYSQVFIKKSYECIGFHTTINKKMIRESLENGDGKGIPTRRAWSKTGQIIK